MRQAQMLWRQPKMGGLVREQRTSSGTRAPEWIAQNFQLSPPPRRSKRLCVASRDGRASLSHPNAQPFLLA